MAIVVTDDQNYKDIADAIREKGATGTFLPNEMANAILELSTDSTEIGDIKLSAQMPTEDGTWLECDGRYISQEDYPELFDVLRTLPVGDGWNQDGANAAVHMAHSDNVWVAVTNAGNVYTATEPHGIWTLNDYKLPVTASQEPKQLVYGDGWFLCVCSGGICFFTQNPSSVWLSQEYILPVGNDYSDVIWIEKLGKFGKARWAISFSENVYFQTFSIEASEIQFDTEVLVHGEGSSNSNRHISIAANSVGILVVYTSKYHSDNYTKISGYFSTDGSSWTKCSKIIDDNDFFNGDTFGLHCATKGNSFGVVFTQYYINWGVTTSQTDSPLGEWKHQFQEGGYYASEAPRLLGGSDFWVVVSYHVGFSRYLDDTLTKATLNQHGQSLTCDSLSDEFFLNFKDVPKYFYDNLATEDKPVPNIATPTGVKAYIKAGE